MNNFHHCIECGNTILKNVHDFSIAKYGVPLCLKHQYWLDKSHTTEEARKLYFALKGRNVPVTLEYNDGIKTVDIAVPGQVYVEVDGQYHLSLDQTFNDFLRDSFARKGDIPTFKISNEHISDEHHFAMVVERMTEICSGYRIAG